MFSGGRAKRVNAYVGTGATKRRGANSKLVGSTKKEKPLSSCSPRWDLVHSAKLGLPLDHLARRGSETGTVSKVRATRCSAEVPATRSS